MESQNTAGKEKKPSKVVDVLTTILLVLAIVAAIVCSYTAFVTKAGDGVPSIFGIRPFSVQSDSMAPTFYEGDLVIDKVVDPATLQVGDIVTFWTVINGYKVLNTHRITSVEDYGNYLYFQTKGDANPVEDSSGVHQNEIVGKYVTHIPKVGKFLDFLQTSKGFFICIVIPVAAFFIYQLIVFIKTLMEYNTEKIKLQMKEEQEKEKEEKKKKKAEKLAEAKKAAEEEAAAEEDGGDSDDDDDEEEEEIIIVKKVKKKKVKTEEVKTEEIKAEEIKAEEVKAEEAKPEAAKTEEAKPREPVRESAKEEPAKEESAEEQPVKEEPVKEESVKEEPAKEEPVKEEPAKEEAAKEEPVKGEAEK